jgi:hypothetical protein
MTASIRSIQSALVVIEGRRFHFMSPRIAKALAPNRAVTSQLPHGAGSADQRTRSAGQPSSGDG